jgi:hypothetical protein
MLVASFGLSMSHTEAPYSIKLPLSVLLRSMDCVNLVRGNLCMAAQIPSRLLSQHDEDNQTPLWRAFERFSRTLDAEEKAAFTDATLAEVLVNVRGLDQLCSMSSVSRNLTRRLEPFLQFLDRHSRAIDSMVQAHPYPSALIWGIVRVLLEVISPAPCG